MAYARVSYIGDGSTTIYTVPFPYLSEDYIEIREGGILKAVDSDYTWLTSSTIQFNSAPTSGVRIVVLRNTPKQNRLVNYQDGNILKEETLDLDSDQAFHIAQETLDAVENVREVETFVGGVDYTAGVTTSLSLTGSDMEDTSLTVLFDGVVQHQTEYSLSGSTLTFTEAIPTGVQQVQVSYAIPLTGGFPDSSITTPKIADLNVTTGKLADEVVTEPKLAQSVFSDLTAVTAATGDHVVIADASDSGNKKKTLVSSILSLIATATTAVTGLVRLATGSEALGGTNNTAALTSAGLASQQVLNQNGYTMYVGGKLEQWGEVAGNVDVVSGGLTLVWTYPIAFPTAVFSATAYVRTQDSGNARHLTARLVNATLTQATFLVIEHTASAQTTWSLMCEARGK